MSVFPRLLAVALASSLIACADDPPDHEVEVDHVKRDASTRDASTRDAATRDAAAVRDAGRDAAFHDAFVPDAGEPVRDAALVVVDQDAVGEGALFGVHHWNGAKAPELVDAVGTWIGRPLDLAMAYASSNTWTEMQNLGYTLPSWAKWIAARTGRRLLFSVPMLPGDNDGSGDDGKVGTADDVSLAACAKGAYDKYWANIGGQLVDAGLGNTIVRLGWESDGDWFTWAAKGKEADYAGCFQHAAKAMREARPGGKLAFDFSVSEDVYMWSPAQREALYPGDDVVDVCSVNAYDASWANDSYPIPDSNCDDACKARRRLNGWNDMMQGVMLVRDFAAAHHKLYAIAEWGLWKRSDGHGGGDNADYIGRIYDYVTNPANHVYYQSYFDVDYTDGAHQLSDVSGDGQLVPAGHGYQSMFPMASAKYKELFGKP